MAPQPIGLSTTEHLGDLEGPPLVCSWYPWVFSTSATASSSFPPPTVSPTSIISSYNGGGPSPSAPPLTSTLSTFSASMAAPAAFAWATVSILVR